jgi:hypothetical protein
MILSPSKRSAGKNPPVDPATGGAKGRAARAASWTDELARQRRNAALVADADAAVVVWDRADRDLGDLLGRCRRKAVPVRVIVPDGPGDAGPERDCPRPTPTD